MKISSSSLEIWLQAYERFHCSFSPIFMLVFFWNTALLYCSYIQCLVFILFIWRLQYSLKLFKELKFSIGFFLEQLIGLRVRIKCLICYYIDQLQDINDSCWSWITFREANVFWPLVKSLYCVLWEFTFNLVDQNMMFPLF